MLFATFCEQFSFNQVFRPKMACDCVYRRFLPFSVCVHTGLNVGELGGGMQMGLAYNVELSRPDMISPILLSVGSQLSQVWAGSPTNSVGRFVRTHDA
jgi:hypothetical protein